MSCYFYGMKWRLENEKSKIKFKDEISKNLIKTLLMKNSFCHIILL